MWIGADDDVPQGTVGEIELMMENGRLGVGFPGYKGAFLPHELVLATPEQAAQWAATKAEALAAVAASACTTPRRAAAVMHTFFGHVDPLLDEAALGAVQVEHVHLPVEMSRLLFVH